MILAQRVEKMPKSNLKYKFKNKIMEDKGLQL